jgi:hypothetical protein
MFKAFIFLLATRIRTAGFRASDIFKFPIVLVFLTFAQFSSVTTPNILLCAASMLSKDVSKVTFFFLSCLFNSDISYDKNSSV